MTVHRGDHKNNTPSVDRAHKVDEQASILTFTKYPQGCKRIKLVIFFS